MKNEQTQPCAHEDIKNKDKQRLENVKLEVTSDNSGFALAVITDKLEENLISKKAHDYIFWHFYCTPTSG